MLNSLDNTESTPEKSLENKIPSNCQCLILRKGGKKVKQNNKQTIPDVF
jgi:hypothetical protein